MLKNPTLRKVGHQAHNYAHLAYFGAVFIEAHGVYAIMGGVLLVMGLGALVVGET